MDLTVTKREKFGKAVKTLRREGLVPAELYGRGLANLHLTVPLKEFAKAFKQAGAHTVVNVLLDSKKHPVLIHDVKKNYLTNEIEHVDFYAVRMDEKIKAKVPIEFIGDAPAVKEKGGIVNKAMLEIEVEALPANLPHRLEVNLGGLVDLNQSIYVKDLTVPKDVTIAVALETVIVTVTPPLAEEVVEAPVDLTAVKVESEEKKAERATEKEKGEEGAAPVTAKGPKRS